MKKVQIKKFFVLLSVLTLTIALGGCSGDKDSSQNSNTDNSSQETAQMTEGGSIVVGIPQDIEDSLDPHVAVAAGTEEILFNIYEGLVKPDEEGNLVDAVASAHEISEDGKTYTFTLRDGVKFHDDTEVTVEDVVYSIERCADTSNGEPLVSAFSIIESVTAVDEKTVEIKLTEANTEFLAYMTTAIIPKHNETPDTVAIGTGPFKYVSRSPQDNIVIEKFADYYDQDHAAHLDKVTFKVISDANTIVTSLKSGAIDMFSRLTSTQVAELSSTDVNIYEGTMNLVQALYLNNAKAPFDDVRVRQALCYAINRQEVLDMNADGKGTIIGSSMFPAFEKYYLPELADTYNQDLDKAKELLKEAGFEDGFTFTITVPSNYQPHIDTAQVLVEQLKQIGVTAEINLVEWDSWLSDVYTDRNYESTVVGVDASALTGRALLERFDSEAGNNFINYSNPEYDKLFDQVISTVDEEEQVKLYKEMEQLLTEDAANVYIQDMANLVALSDKYSGYEFYPLYVMDMAKIYQAEK